MMRYAHFWVQEIWMPAYRKQVKPQSLLGIANREFPHGGVTTSSRPQMLRLQSGCNLCIGIY